MKIKLLDTVTGITIDDNDDQKSIYHWSMGDGSCDCNRSIAFGQHDEQAEILGFSENRCLGNTRYLVIEVGGNLEGRSRKDALSEVNDEYQPEFVKKFIDN